MIRRTAAVLAALVLASGCSSGTAEKKEQADALPDVTLKPLRADGRAIDLGTLKGPAVVNLWANWCRPCRKEMPVYERFSKTHPGVRVIGVNTLDTQRGKAREVADQAGVTYPLVVDPDQRVRAIALPTLVLVDRTGRVTWSRPVQIKSLAQLEGLVKKHLG